MSRQLWETVADLASSALAGVPQGLVRITELEVDLPLDVRLRPGPGGTPVFQADLPGFRWRSPLDREPGRLRIRYRSDRSS